MASAVDACSAASRSGLFFAIVVALAAAAFVMVYAFRPLTIEFLNSTYDDALYIRLGMNIAEGQWLGPYDQLTLAKGPGYPLFLALNSWLGLPVSVGQALLHVLGAGVFSWAVRGMTGSRWLGLASFLFLLWNPWFVTQRLVREAIYTALIFLFLGLALYCTFVARFPWRRAGAAFLAGVVLTWCWLTREEGVLLLPAIGLLFISGWWWHRHSLGHARQLFVATGVAVAAFLGAHLAFQATNYRYYQSFVGVDMAERNFVAALDALQSVRMGDEKIFVPLTRAARERLYQVSPAFASLKNYFDPPSGPPWAQACDYWPWTCGEIGSGWFLWALRGAAAVNGHYRTPAMAKRFYGTLAAEVKAACDNGKLRCERSWISYMPNVNRAQLAWIPRETLRAWLVLASAPAPDAGGSAGEAVSLQNALKFLNHPVHMPAGSTTLRHVFTGWYWPGRSEWFDLQVRGPGGTGTLVRSASPDLAAYFKDPEATQQRFRMEVLCHANCRLKFRAVNGDENAVPLDQLMGNITARQHSLPLGAGTLWFDAFEADKPFLYAPRVVASRHIRAAITDVYAQVVPGFLAFGLAALGGAVLLALPRRRSPQVVLAVTLAATLWLLVATRLGALVLISISSFPALNILYMSPAFYLAPIAALVSFWALGQAAWHMLAPLKLFPPGRLAKA